MAGTERQNRYTPEARGEMQRAFLNHVRAEAERVGMTVKQVRVELGAEEDFATGYHAGWEDRAPDAPAIDQGVYEEALDAHFRPAPAEGAEG